MGDASRSGPADSHLAHHFDTPRQQFSAGKLGMWLFIATELLMFGGLFCAYATVRGNDPAVLEWGSQYLDRTWGYINTMVLIFSSLTMALAVRAAACGQQRQLVLFLTLTLICAVDFMVVKYLEYSHKFHDHLVWGEGFYQGAHAVAEGGGPIVIEPGDAGHGSQLFGSTCAACHGRDAAGLADLGPSLRENEFAASLDDLGLVAFLKAGRATDDPRNTTGLLMPAKGGNPMLSDQDLADITTYLRTFQQGGGAVAEEPAPDVVVAAAAEEPIHRSVIPVAATGPLGLAPRTVAADGRKGLEATSPLTNLPMPPNAPIFFALYFCMTGLHGIHVLVGIALITWLRVRAVRGDFSGEYYTPVDFVGLYWHVVDIIWIFLFPLLYLI